MSHSMHVEGMLGSINSVILKWQHETVRVLGIPER